MQTFLPYPCFQRSAEVLDPVRRWKQCVEARQLVKALEQGPLCRYDLAERKFVYGPISGSRPPAGSVYRTTPWYSHPACRMWRGRVDSLKLYFNTMLVQVLKVGSHVVTAFKCYDLTDYDGDRFQWPNPSPPTWLGHEDFHAAHRSNLLRKLPTFYGQYGWTEANDLEYVWPSP